MRRHSYAQTKVRHCLQIDYNLLNLLKGALVPNPLKDEQLKKMSLKPFLKGFYFFDEFVFVLLKCLIYIP